MQKEWLLLVILIIILLGAGCTSVAPQALPELNKTTHTPTPSMTTSPTVGLITPTSTQTRFPTATKQPNTDTPQPTVSAEMVRSKILMLLEENGGCRLPCLWGMEAGQTSLLVLDNFILGFYDLETQDDYIRVQDYGDFGGFTFSHRNEKVIVFIDFSYYLTTDNQNIEMFTMYAYAMREYGTTPEGALDLRPQYGDPYFTETLQYYTLSNILTVYGPPERVLVATWPDDPEYTPITTWPFSLVLLYQKQGIFLEYESVRESDGSNFVGCPSKSQIHVGVWDPKQSLPLYYIAEKAGAVINDLNYSYFKPLEEATEFTVEEFYETFKDPDYNGCLETPANLWSP